MATKEKYIHFTEKQLEDLSVPVKPKYDVYHDKNTRGLILIVTYGGTKTYYSYLKFQGLPTKTKIGRLDSIKLVDARKKVDEFRVLVNKGEDPSEDRRFLSQDVTLKEFYDAVYVKETIKAENSRKNDNSIFNHHLSGFHNRKMITIKKEEIKQLYNKTRNETSVYTANKILTLLKHIYKIAMEYNYPKKYGSPTDGLKKQAEPSRDRFLSGDELTRLFEVLEQTEDDFIRNYILLSLYVGQRRTSILSAKWEQVDFKNGLLYLPKTKNGQSYYFPLSEKALLLLESMKANSTSEWLFPSSRNSKSGHVEDPKRPFREVMEKAGIKNIRIHDLRRTYGTYLAMSGAGLPVIGSLLGHKSLNSTSVYARFAEDHVKDMLNKGVDRIADLGESKE